MLHEIQLTDLLIRFRTQMIGIAHEAVMGSIPTCTSTTTGVAYRILQSVAALDREAGEDLRFALVPLNDRPGR